MLNLAYQLYACFLDWHSQILPLTKAQPNSTGFEVDDRLQEFLSTGMLVSPHAMVHRLSAKLASPPGSLTQIANTALQSVMPNVCPYSTLGKHAPPCTATIMWSQSQGAEQTSNESDPCDALRCMPMYHTMQGMCILS